MRSISDVIVVLIIIAVTVSTLVVALTVISGYLKTQKPHGESIDVSISVEKTGGLYNLGTIKATIYITCTGPNCDKYSVSRMTLYGFDPLTNKKWQLSSDSNIYNLQHGVTTLSILGYYDVYTQQISEVTVYFVISGPSNYYREVYKSVSLA